MDFNTQLKSVDLVESMCESWEYNIEIDTSCNDLSYFGRDEDFFITQLSHMKPNSFW